MKSVATRRDSVFMADISDLNKEELQAISEVIDLWQKIWVTLTDIELSLKVDKLHIQSNSHRSYYLGYIHTNENGDMVFQPAQPVERPDHSNQEIPISRYSLILKRVNHIRQICEKVKPKDDSKHWDDREWLAQSIINILDGKTDDD